MTRRNCSGSSRFAVLLLALAAFAPRAPGCEPGDVDLALAAGEYVEAETCARERVGQPGLPVPEELAAIDALVRALLAGGCGSTPEALSWARRGLELAAGTQDPAAMLAASRGLALVALEQEPRADDPIALLDPAVAARRGQGEPLALAECLLDAAQARVLLEKVPEGLDLLSEAEALLAGIDPAEGELATARLEELRAFGHQILGDFPAMRLSLERAFEIRERRAPDHPDTALTHGRIGDLNVLEGRIPEAVEAYRRGADLLEARLGPHHPLLVRSLGRLAAAHANAGDLTTSFEIHERALQLSLEQYGPDHPETGVRLNDFANARLLDGDLDGARELYGQALLVAQRRSEPGRTMELGTIRYNLGLVEKEAPDPERAANHFLAAADLWSGLRGPDHPFVALVLEELAAVRRMGGETEQARALLERALAIRRKALGDEHPATATAARSLGEVALELHDLPAAVRAAGVARHALGAAKSILPAETAGVLALDARVAVATGADPSGALTTALEAEATSRDHLRGAVRYLAEADALKLAGQSPQALDLALSILAAKGGDAEVRRRVYDAAIRSRALVLDTIAARSHAAAATPEFARSDLWKRLDGASRQVANLLYRGPSGPLEAHAQLVAHARRERDAAERELALANADFQRGLMAERAGFAEVAGALPPGTTLVSLVRYERTEIRRGTTGPSGGAYLAFVSSTGDAAPRAVPLGPAAPVDAAVEAWRDAVRDVRGALEDGRESERAYRRAAGRLAQLLWRPIARHVRGPRVFVVPDGLTQVVNLAVLPAPHGRYLLETGLEFHVLPAERDLLRDAGPGPSAPPAGLLAVGAPAYRAPAREIAATAAAYPASSDFGQAPDLLARADPSVAEIESKPALEQPAPAASRRGTRSACDSADSLAFGDLPESGGEAGEVAGHWESAGQGAAATLSGTSASVALFTRLAPGRRVVHVATHGFFLDDSCSRRAAAASVGSAPRDELRENPMLLAGLAFAGANRRHRAAPDEDDGILTAEEISRLSLGPVEWVVLSACDTGRGHIRNGEGVLGLRRAFQVAGARSVIGSLWPVDDTYARLWMSELYAARLERGLDTVGSAAAASRAVLSRLRAEGRAAHPALWGAFITTGDWR